MSAAGVWYNITGVFASATSRLVYRNGVAGTANTTSVIPVGLSQNIIGKSTSGNTAKGTIGFAAIWSAALTAVEVQAINQGANMRRIRPASLISLLYLTGPLANENDFVSPTAWTYAGGGVPNEANNPRIFF
jgi:Concanavalin A-like lectin/glucanases superfamily